MRKWLYILAAVLLVPALTVNLGLMVFIDDEAIRSLVAQEMLWSGNYLVPTMHGDAYLNKPPLWNWILALSFYLHGFTDEWSSRLPTVICLLGFALTTYQFSKPHFGRYLAAIHALTVITCGRMLFWDSMLALIDVCFSWVVYTQIMLLYKYGKDGRWWRAFAWSYLLTAVGFMLKGLPAIVFQGLSVFALLWWRSEWRQLFRPAHLAAGVGCLLLLSLYYIPYGQYVDLERVAGRLFVESGKRTAVSHGLWQTVSHIFAFPFEMAYHFLPWTLLLVYLLRRGAWQRLRQNDFAAFLLVVFLFNLPIYWLSPNVYPRYLLMLFPLLFGSLLWLHKVHAEAQSISYRVISYLFLGAMTICTLVIPFIPLLEGTSTITNAWLKSITLGGLAGALAWIGWQKKADLLLVFCCFLLLLRVVFNFFVLPPRAAGDERGQEVRATANRVADTFRDDSLLVFRHSLIEPATGYYLTLARGEVVRRQFGNYRKEAIYLGSPRQYPDLVIEPTDSLYLRHQKLYYPVGRLIEAGKRTEEELRDGMGSGVILR